jgi:hypothetical protein
MQTGLANFPCRDFANNAAWLLTVLMACDLIAWTQQLTLEGEMTNAEPNRLRYCLLYAGGRIATSGRRTRLRLQQNWPWSAISPHFAKLKTLPLRA